MNFKTPKDLRKGQTIFVFLEWLKNNKGYSSEFTIDFVTVNGRMADPFYIEDDEFDKLYNEFLETHDRR